MPNHLADIMEIGLDSLPAWIVQYGDHLFVQLGGKMDAIPNSHPDDRGHKQKVNEMVRDNEVRIFTVVPDSEQVGKTKKWQCQYGK